jgi:hypothetical protein
MQTSHSVIQQLHQQEVAILATKAQLQDQLTDVDKRLAVIRAMVEGMKLADQVAKEAASTDTEPKAD